MDFGLLKTMSELLTKLSGIKRLPIFPLPLVLLPNELLPLHIFEPRYRQMLTDIETTDNFFGVNFFNPSESFVEKPAAGAIGCAAEVRKVENLPDGRSNVLTMGVMRFRLLDYLETDAPYLLGDVEFFEDETENPEILTPLADEVFALFKRIAAAAHKLGNRRGVLPEVPPAAPEQLSFLVTAAFDLDTELKYRLLEMRSTVERLDKLREILRQAVGKMEESAEIQKISHTNGHSKKKIEL